MKTVRKTLFGLSAYMPLFILFFMLSWTDPYKTMRYIGAGLSALAIIVGMCFHILFVVGLSDSENHTRMMIGDLRRIGVSTGQVGTYSYLSAVLLVILRMALLYTGSVNPYFGLFIYIPALAVVFMVIADIIVNDRAVMNPLLAIYGYRFYELNATFKGVSGKRQDMHTILISKTEPGRNTSVSVKEIADGCYVNLGMEGFD